MDPNLEKKPIKKGPHGPFKNLMMFIFFMADFYPQFPIGIKDQYWVE